MKSVSTTPISWFPLTLPGELTLEQLQRVVHTCTALATLRIITTDHGDYSLEIGCTDDQDHLVVEALVQQVLADITLRDRIALDANSELTDLVEEILTKVGTR